MTTVSWLISIILGLSAVLWTLLVVLWESQLQLGFYDVAEIDFATPEKTRCSSYGLFLWYKLKYQQRVAPHSSDL